MPANLRSLNRELLLQGEIFCERRYWSLKSPVTAAAFGKIENRIVHLLRPAVIISAECSSFCKAGFAAR